jgi:membrane protein DedA with SNARE-associated domain
MNDPIYFLIQHGAAVLFAVVFAKQIGLPLPAFPSLIVAGALVGTGQMAFCAAVGSSVLAAFAGDQLWFEFGRRYGRRLLDRLGRSCVDLTLPVRKTEEFFAHHGLRSLIVSKFVPILSTIAPPFAGMVGISMSLYFRYNSFGTILWVGSGLGLGYAFSARLEQAISMMGQVGSSAGLTLLGIGTGYVAYKVFDRYRAERDRERPALTSTREDHSRRVFPSVT